MAKSLQQFLAAATSDNVRANNTFEMTCTSGVDAIDKVLENAVMFGQNFTLPERGQSFASVYFKGYEITNLVPTAITMGNEHSVTMLMDINGEYRRAFLAWMNEVMNANISDGSVFEGDRGVNEKSVVRITLFDKDNKTPCETYKFYNVRISQVGPVTLTYEGGDKATFEVTFKSTYWELESATNGGLTNIK